MGTRAQAWVDAHRLVVSERATYADAAAATGLPVSTIQKRAATEGWQAEQETATSYTSSIRKLKTGLLDQAMRAMETNADPSQLVFAWKTAEAAFPEHRYNPKKTDPKVALAVVAGTVELLVELLTEKDRNALAVLEPWIMELGKRAEAKYGAS